jgi:hypothetical protein
MDKPETTAAGISPETIEARIDRAMRMMADDFDWTAYEERDELHEPGIDGPEDAFRACCVWSSIDEPWTFKMAEVGSRKAGDTPRALYRLLWLMRPTDVDFSDMYKSGLFAIESPDRRYAVVVELYKYAIGLYFYAPRETVPPKMVRGFDIQSGIPGVDNGWKTTDPVAVKFFELVCRAADREWDVYGGNDFKV